jgi:hypothetical protein
MVQQKHANLQTVIAAVDWGFTNAGVIQTWAVDRDRRMYLIHETYQTRQTIDWWVTAAKAAKEKFQISRFICDPSQPSFIEIFKRERLRAELANNDISLGIQKVKERLQIQPDGLPRIFFLRNALEKRDPELVEDKLPACALDEIGAYLWPTGSDGKAIKEKPVDAHNHSMDCVRYAVLAIDKGARPARRRANNPLFR